MAKRLYITLSVELPPDPFAAGSTYAKLQPAWAALLDALKASGAEHDVKFSELEQRTRAKRTKPKLVKPAAEQLFPDEAA